jgi:hypothetical protein
MKRLNMVFVMALTVLLGSLAFAQTVRVTFIANTATVPDTLWPDKAVVQARGDTSPLTWNGSSGVNFTNIGGDYWTANAEFPANDTIYYKFFTNATSATGDNENKGWEQNSTDPSGNRVLITGTTDIVVPVQFVNGTASNKPADFKPWGTADSIAIWVRVNMQGWQAFNPATDMIGVRGGASPGYLGNISWGHTKFLQKEDQHGNGGSRQYNADNFYSGVILLPRDSVTVGQKVEYKFVIATADPNADPKTWESINNRSVVISAGKTDTTILWDWFNQVRPVPFVGADTLNLTFRVDLSKAIQTRGYKTGDTILVSTGWNGSGRDAAGNSPVRTILTKKGFTNVYEGQQQIIAALNGSLYYQYYVVKEAQDIRESFYNFDYTGSDNSLAERRMFKPDAVTMAIEDIEVSSTSARRMPTFRNLSVLARGVKVTWTCDLRPAYYTTLLGDTLFDIQGTDHITNSGMVYTSGLMMNGPATGGWTTWGQTLRDDAPKVMWDDGTHGDAVSGDHIYTVQIQYAPDSTGSKKFVGQEFKFGIKGGDNEGGRGGFGNNHYENIDDTQAEVTINSQFGSINPKYYRGWDYNTQTQTGVEQLGGIPVVYKLDQNYPNPFNPSTTITYSVPTAGNVTLKVFNALGQQLTTLVSGPAEAGNYKVVFDASGFQSGVYMYELRGNGFTQVRTMTLVK